MGILLGVIRFSSGEILRIFFLHWFHSFHHMHTSLPLRYLKQVLISHYQFVVSFVHHVGRIEVFQYQGL